MIFLLMSSTSLLALSAGLASELEAAAAFLISSLC